MSLRLMIRRLEVVQQSRDQTGRRLSRLWDQFSQQVRGTREQRGLTLAQLSRRMGIEKSELSYLETGKRSWRIDLARRAVRVLR